MFRTIAQIPTWSTPAYVCHRCRHSIVAATAAAQKQSKRHTTTSTPASSGERSTKDIEERTFDDWMSNFNDIGDSLRPDGQTSKDDRPKTRKPGGNNRFGVKAEQRDSDRAIHLVDPQREHSNLPRHSARGPRHENVRRRAAVRDRPPKHAEHDVELPEPVLPPMMAQLDGLIASMRSEMSARDSVPQLALSPGEHSEKRLVEDETATARLPNPFGSTALGIAIGVKSSDYNSPHCSRDVKESMETVASSKDELDTAVLDSLPSRPERSSAKRRSLFGTHRSSHPLLSKAQITNERAAWGDSMTDAVNEAAKAASYETLREADRLSRPDPINPRQLATKTWGGRPTAADTNVRSRDDLSAVSATRGNDLTAEVFVDMHTNAELQDKGPKSEQSSDESREFVSKPHDTSVIVNLSELSSSHPHDSDHSHAQDEENKAISSGADQDHAGPREKLLNLHQKRPQKLRTESGLLPEVRERADTIAKELGHSSIVRDAMPAPSEAQGRRGRPRSRAVSKHTEGGIASKTPASSTDPTNALADQPSVPGSIDAELADHDDTEMTTTIEDADIRQLNARDLHIVPLDIDQPAIPQLAYGLDRVLFNPGVYQLQDPHSRVFNFDPYLQKIMPVADFDFNALKEYKTSSEDTVLSDLAKEHGKSYVGSTSSMTSTLSHFHFLLSNFRDLNLNMLSKAFPDNSPSLTKLNRAPSAMFLRWKNGTYAIDADKEFDSGNVLMMLGKSMEILLTRSQSEYERYRKSDPREVSKEDRDGPEAYQYTTMGDFLMRSQLDAHDPRLPGTGTFDLKTRAVVSVRMNAEDYVPMTGYEIYTTQGRWNSYEREYYDMIRSTMLKYSLQARMGRMDGILVAYHNVTRIFGFQYISINEMDRALHGQVDRCLGDQEFKLSIDLYNKVLDMATEKFPERSLRFFFETRPGRGDRPATLTVFAEPMEEKEIEHIQGFSKARIAEFERTMMGKEEKPQEVVDTMSPEMRQADVSKSVYTNTETAADPSFISRIETSSDATHRPLFCATILLYNYTKLKTEPETAWQHCEGNRPINLTADREWRVEYILKEPSAEMNESTRWAMYEDVKYRRKDAYWKGKEEEGEETVGHGSGKKEGGDYFRDLLRSMSEKDAGVRRRLDQLEEGNEKTVVGTPTFTSAATAEDASERHSLEQVSDAVKDMQHPSKSATAVSIDDYMQSLYGRADERLSAP